MIDIDRKKYLVRMVMGGIIESVPLCYMNPLPAEGDMEPLGLMTRVPKEVLYETYVYGFLKGMGLEEQEGDREFVREIANI